MSIFTENPGLKEDIIARFFAGREETGHISRNAVLFFVTSFYPEVLFFERDQIYRVIQAKQPLTRVKHHRLIDVREWKDTDPSRWSGRIFHVDAPVATPAEGPIYGFTDEEDIITFKILFGHS